MFLQTNINNYLSDPYDPMYNFNLALTYETQGHTASAAGYFLRCAEFSKDDLLCYESLLRMSLCFQRQGGRVFTTKGVLLRAISLIPDRPEGYFLLSRLYEQNKDWQEAYTYATLGLKLNDFPPLRTDVEYPGKFGFTFEKGVSAWWIGLIDESLYLMKKLNKNPLVTGVYKQSVTNNLSKLNNWKDPILYDESDYENLRFKFNGSKKIKRNYSQCYQDMFVLSMLNGKRNGTYLEIGCGDPYFGNNTYLLESEFGWKGVSIDIDKGQTDKWTSRKNVVICGDATQLDYGIRDYSYLQIDCDPSLVSYEVLKRILKTGITFSVITFEHDDYAEENGVKEKSRLLLRSYGYEMVVNNIAPDKYNSYEDWWVHPSLIEKDIIDIMRCISDSPKKCDEYMLV
jgi:hypothetical protein